jgi:Ser/Thr protein kinase RdoA (MazF antagonist)
VLARYDLGALLSAERVGQGLLSRVLRVRTEAGEFALKLYLNDTGQASGPVIAGQHRAVAALAAHGVPAVAPLPAREGRTLVLVRGRRYALFPWVPGGPAPAAYAPEQARELGTVLGRAHARLADFQPTPVRQVRESADPARTLAEIDHLLARARLHQPREDVDLLAEHHLRVRRELLRAHADARPARDEVPPEGWVHGDFHPLNVLYRDGRLVAMIDWDRLGVRPRAEEAVRAATQFFARADGVLDLARVREYARAYRTASGTPVSDVRLAVRRVWWERLNDFWMLRWRYARGDSRPSSLFPAAAAQILWWTEDYQQVLDAYTN